MGPGGGGWISGACTDMPPREARDRARRAAFTAARPEWTIVRVASRGIWEASAGSTDTELVILCDSYLGALMDRLEARYPVPPS